MSPHRHGRRDGVPVIGRRGFATLVVFGVLIVALVAVSIILTSSLADAVAGRESLARVRAWWAARSGVEAAIARLEWDTLNPDTADAFQTLIDMAEVANGELDGATYAVGTWDDGRLVPGPMDAHSRINVNTASPPVLLGLEPFMAEDAIDSILDWVDGDDDVRELGAEVGYYQGLPRPYEPRNGPIRHLQELELVAGIDMLDVRGEDANLNGVLDPNEDDGDATPPADNRDGVLQAGWSGWLTGATVEGTLGLSGEPRLDLSDASVGEISQRIQATPQQAQVIADYIAESQGASLEDFIQLPLASLAVLADGGTIQGGRVVPAPGQQPPNVEPLTREQLGALLQECTLELPGQGALTAGRVNINTCSEDVLEVTLNAINGLPQDAVDAIIDQRRSLPQGFLSMADLLDVPGVSATVAGAVAQLFTTRSTVFVVTSRGRDTNTGIEVEMTVTLDRSTLPVSITEVIIR